MAKVRSWIMCRMDRFWMLVLMICPGFSHTHALADVERIREVDESMYGRRSRDAYQAIESV